MPTARVRARAQIFLPKKEGPTRGGLSFAATPQIATSKLASRTRYVLEEVVTICGVRVEDDALLSEVINAEREQPQSLPEGRLPVGRVTATLLQVRVPGRVHQVNHAINESIEGNRR